MKNNDMPVRVIMKVHSNGKVVHYYHQTKRRDFKWYFNRAKFKKLSDWVYFCVEYVKGKNDMDCHSMEDLKWGYQCFYKEYL